MPRLKVLVTGASGYIASQVLPGLREQFDCRLVDARETDRFGKRIEGILHADLSDLDLRTNRSHFREIDVVLHLAYLQPEKGQASMDPENYLVERTNIDMARNVYQLSLEEGVRRVVVASSNHAADWYESLIHSRKKDVVYPWERAVSDNFYGWAKEAYEHLGFVYAAGKLGRQIEVIQLRIGAPREIVGDQLGSDPLRYQRDLGAYISPRDLTQLCSKSVEAGCIQDAYGIPFQIFYGISDNTRKFWSIVNARQVIGYAPEDDSEVKYAEDIRRHLIRLGTPVPAREFHPGPGLT